MQSYTFSIKHKAGTLNKVADALSRRHTLLSTMQVQTIRCETLKELHIDDSDFAGIWQKSQDKPYPPFTIQDGFIFKAKFAYNISQSRTTCKTPFEVVNGVNPITLLDLTPLPTTTHFSSRGEEHAQQVQQIHAQVQARITKHNQKYKQLADTHRKRIVCKEGHLVWIRLGKYHFPAGRFGKLQPRAEGPFQLLKRINDNAYKFDLPNTYNVSATFNVADLSPYITDTKSGEEEEIKDVEQDSTANLFQGWEYGALD
ncbi:hypothetical protein Tco_0484009 [Tanacetum coccineum]